MHCNEHSICEILITFLIPFCVSDIRGQRKSFQIYLFFFLNITFHLEVWVVNAILGTLSSSYAIQEIIHKQFHLLHFSTNTSLYSVFI